MLSEKLIEDFLNEYKRSRVIIETSVRSVLKRAMTYEKIFQKDFIDFTKNEVLQMFTEAHIISINGIQNQKLFLSHCARWILDQKGRPTENVYDILSKDDLLACIDTEKKKNLIITKGQLNEIQDELLNYVDKCIINLLFLGIGNKEWLRDLTYLQKEQISKSEMCIYLKSGYVIPLTQKEYDIVIAAFDETEVVSYTPGSTKVASVLPGSLFKIRANTLYDSANSKSNVEAEKRYRFIQRRLKIISDYVGISLTAKSLNFSGYLHYSKEEMKQLGIEDFRQYIRTEQGEKLAAHYGWHGPNYASIVLEKCKDFI